MSVKTNSDFTKLFGQRAGATADGVNLSRLLLPTKSTSLAVSRGAATSASPGRSSDVRSLPFSETGTAKAINFGSPSSNRAVSSQGASEWTNLLKQTASGGVTSALGGGALSAVGGLGSLVSSIAALFGGGTKTEAPLTLFKLPDSQSQTLFASSNGTGASQAGNTRAGGIYVTPPSGSSVQVEHGQPSPVQSAQITEAVKQALLNSSSLNDVIAEI